jgi:hypothetical protein
MACEHNYDVESNLASALDSISFQKCELHSSLDNLKNQLLPYTDEYSEDEYKRITAWWDENGRAWVDNLRALMLKHRDIGYERKFTSQQKELLKHYYEANKLLGDCIKSASNNLTVRVPSQIEETLLLPIAEIENRSHRG